MMMTTDDLLKSLFNIDLLFTAKYVRKQTKYNHFSDQ